MKRFSVKGTVRALGQVEINKELQYYSWIEIQREDGQLFRIEKVAVGNAVLSMFDNGYEGEFFFDSLSDKKRLFGIKLAGGAVAYDETNLNVAVGMHTIAQGIPMLILFGFGIFWIILGIYYIVTQDEDGRHRMFYGADPAEAQRLKKQVPVRI
jgi:hypothetical protein